MAKQQKFTLNDFAFDKNLDVPDFDFDLKPPKDTRKPITKFGSGLKEGVSMSVKNTAFVKSMIEKALPRGYGSAFDVAEKSASSLKSLYDDTTKEIRPFMNDLKRTTARLLPKLEGGMPDKLKKQVKEWTDTADARPGNSNYDPREAEVSAMLAGMVTAQAQLQQQQSSDNDVKDRLREGLEQVRHRDKLTQMDSMRTGISQLVDYQANVTANYHRKSLELQYRHYFVAVDALEETKRSNAEMRQILQGVLHNTSLPEQVKLHASDSFKAMAKRQAMGVLGSTILGRGNEFFTNLTGNLKKSAMNQVKGAVGLGRTGLDTLNGALDADDMAAAMGMQTDPAHMAGLGAGALGTGVLGEWLAKKMAPHLAKMPGVKKFGNKLQYGVENIPQMLGEWARGSKGENGGLTDGLVRFLKQNVKNSTKMQTGLQKDNVTTMGDASYFSRQSAKSLNEIIPGYLARMLQELQIMRTGDAGVEMIHYDYTKNKFDKQSAVRKNAFNSLVKGNEKQWTTDSVDTLIDSVDSKKKLTPEQRKALGSQLLRNNVKGRLGGEEVLGNRRRYDGSAAEHADTFASLFRDHFKNDPENEKKHAFANQYNSLGQYASASRDKVQEFSNLGMNDFLNEAGLLNKDEDGVELEKFFDYYYGGEYTPSGGAAGGPARGFSGPGGSGGGTGGPRGRRLRRRGNAAGFGRTNRGGPPPGGAGSTSVPHVPVVMPGGNGAVTMVPHDSPLASAAMGLAATAQGYGTKLYAQGGAAARNYGGQLVTQGQGALTHAQTALTNVGGVTGAVGLARQHAQGLQLPNLGGLLGGLKMPGMIVPSLMPHVQNAGGMINQYGQRAMTGAQALPVAQYKQQVTSYLKSMGLPTQQVTQLANQAAAAMQNAAKQAKSTGSQAWEQTRHHLDNIADQMLGVIHGQDYAGMARSGLNAASGAAGQAGAQGRSYFNNAKDYARNMGASVKSGATSLGQSAKEGLHGLFEAMSGGITAMGEALKSIQERMSNALPVIVVGNAADGSIPSEAIGSAGGKKVRWWNKSIKDTAKGAAGTAWGGMKGAGKLGNWLVGSSFGGLLGTGKLLGGLAGNVGAKMLDKARGFKDVYSEETGPRKVLLFAQKLKAGEYFDVSTGKPVKTWRDIQGAVADSSGVVMTEEQARTAYVKEGMGKKALKGLGAIIKGGAGLGNLIGGGLLGGVPSALKLGMGALKLGNKLLSSYANGPQDVYVFDKDHPKRLRKALDAKTMRAGGYTSAVNDKPIKGPKDIDGEVYNYKGVTVLDDEEFKRGLYDKNGNPLKHGIGRLLSGATKILGGGFGAFKWLADGVNKGVGNAFGLGKGLLGGFAGLFGHSGIFFGGGKKLMTTVEEIRDILKERMPEPHKVRKGSIEDQHKSRKEQIEEEWRKHTGQDKDGDKKSGGLLGLLGGLFKRKKKDDEKEGDHGGLVDDIESGIGQSVGEKILGKGGRLLSKVPGLRRLPGIRGLGGAATAAAEGAVGDVAKRGIGSRLMGGLKWGKGLGAGMALGAAGSLANATGHTTIGSGLDVASTAATGWSLASGAAGLLGVQGGALGLAGAAGGALLTGLGAVLASPVLLPALGVAAAGAALYGGYKLLTRNKLDALSKVRYVQYGWKPDDDGNVSKVFALERALMPGVTYQGGMAAIDPKKVDIKSAVEGLGIDLKDKDQVQSFATWYIRRFKPVFITHLTVLNNLKPGTSLADADGKLKPDEKKKFIDGVRLPGGTFDSMTSPIPGEKQLSASAGDVKAILDATAADIDKDVKDNKDKTTNDKADKANKDAKKDAADKKDIKPQPSWMDSLKSGISNAWDKTKQFAGNAWDATKNAAGAVGSAALSAGAAVGGFASNVVSGAGDALKSGYQAAKSFGGKVGATISASAGAIKSALLGALKTASITDPTETAMFMAQMDTESGGFRSLSENLNYRPSVLMSMFKSHFSGAGDATQVAAEGPEAIANRIYGGRMGNKEPGDGWKYRGRGVVQLTGKDNYAKFGKLAGLDLVNNPDLASDPANAAKIAIAYWKSRVSSAAAKAGDVLSVTKAINGGTNGLSDRAAKFQSYLAQAKQGLLGGKPDAKTADAGAPATPGAMGATSGAGAGPVAAANATDAKSGGLIKVADQTPGPAPVLKTSGAAPTPAATDAGNAAGAVNAMPDSINSQTAAAMGGFQNRNKDLAAQGQFQSESLAKTLGPVSDVLKQSLDVQKQMLTALQQLVGAAAKGGSQAPARAPTGATSPDAMQKRNPQPMGTPPVSMSKTV